MQTLIILILGTIVALVLGYFVTQALVKMVGKFVRNFGGILKTVFVIFGIVAVSWLISNRDRAEEILEEVTEKVDDILKGNFANEDSYDEYWR